MILSRIFAVVSAAFLVAAVALATMGPLDLPLARGLFLVDHDVFNELQSARSWMPDWAWRWGLSPLLGRPIWLLPAALGLVSAGLSATFASRPAPAKKREWES